MANLLIIEDDPTIRQILIEALNEDGHTVQGCASLQEARAMFSEAVEAIILDVNLPDGSGYAYLQSLRAVSAVPVLLLTVRGDEKDVLKGFQLGADDYISKPFSLAILKARLRSVLRRGEPSSEATLYHDENRGEIISKGKALSLSPLEYRLLAYLIANRGCTLTRAQLLARLWDDAGTFVEDNTLSVAIGRLREKLAGEAKIVTARGIGYRLEDEA